MLILNCGEIAHMGFGDTTQPLVGAGMVDRDANIFPAGHGIMIQETKFDIIGDSETLQSEFAPEWDGSDKKSGDLIVVDAKGKAIIPGIVDCHTHLLWGGDRSSEMRLRQAGMTYRQIAEAGGGVESE